MHDYPDDPYRPSDFLLLVVKSYLFYQELIGSPKFLYTSLHTCHALKTPADPPESRL